MDQPPKNVIPIEERRKKPLHKRAGWSKRRAYAVCVALLGAAALLMTATLTLPGYFANSYRVWPAAGTLPAAEFGTEPFYANAIIALTCRDGEPHLDQKFPVKTGYEKHNLQPDSHIDFYTKYEPRDSKTCKVFLPRPSRSPQIVILDYTPESKTWADRSIQLNDRTNLVELVADSDRKDIAVLLINFSFYDQGPEIKLGKNNALAPSRKLLS